MAADSNDTDTSGPGAATMPPVHEGAQMGRCMAQKYRDNKSLDLCANKAKPARSIMNKDGPSLPAEGPTTVVPLLELDSIGRTAAWGAGTAATAAAVFTRPCAMVLLPAQTPCPFKMSCLRPSSLQGTQLVKGAAILCSAPT